MKGAEREGTHDALAVSRETRRRLTVLVDLLDKWNSTVNLVSQSTLDAVWVRHIEDSAQLVRMAPEVETWIDLGSGAGFPGLVVAALATEDRPDLHVTLVESDARKSAFLRTAAREMGVQASVVTARIESLPAQRYDVVSARALAPLTKLLDYAERFSGTETRCLFPKGANAASELTEAEQRWHIRHRIHESATSTSGVVLEILEFSRDPAPQP